MTSGLSAGKGRCRATARLLIKPVRAVVELGAVPDVLSGTFNTVHRVNRRADKDDFVAVALPMMVQGRSCMLPGTEVELIGSEASLAVLLETENLMSLVRRGMVMEPEIHDVTVEPGELGVAYVRDRQGEKYTLGGIERMKRRAERRGKALRTITRKPVSLASRLTLRIASVPVHVQEIVGEMSDAPLLVTTYGFSSAKAPAILPVLPESAKARVDAP